MRKNKPIKRVLFFIAVISGIFSLSLQAQEWMPPGLTAMESKFQELNVQAATLDMYAPEKFPDFQELEKINQLVDQLDFNKRKFKLLIDMYNQVEDKLFPFFLKFSKAHPELNNEILAKVKEYTGKAEKSILSLQEKINVVALQIERLETKIERVQMAARNKELAEEYRQKSREMRETVPISSKILQLEEERKNYAVEIREEEAKLKALKEKEKKESDKINEKRNEIDELTKKTAAAKNDVEQLINQTFIQVREIRLNGLEIPRLNTVKTFIYLSNTSLDILNKKVENIDKEIVSLEKLRQKELVNNFLKGVALIVTALFIILFIIKLSRRISAKIIIRLEKSEKLDAHRKQRYHTLSSVILSFIKIVVWVLGVLWVLGELGIDYAPFLVAAGGISLAIGFGAQSLVKDVVTGFFLLMEEQFALGDFIEIDGQAGTVEKISLRTIKFRGLDGTLHIIPNGSISGVSNKTYQWSRAVVKVGVSYDENTENVLAVLNKVCQEMAGDQQWNDMLIDEPIPQGILSFGDSAVEFRILAKTKPGDQWSVERELHIRIKNAFDRHGIEIPYNFVNVIDRTEKKET
jgi:small conductance mechanosensitive channel